MITASKFQLYCAMPEIPKIELQVIVQTAVLKGKCKKFMFLIFLMSLGAHGVTS